MAQPNPLKAWIVFGVAAAALVGMTLFFLLRPPKPRPPPEKPPATGPVSQPVTKPIVKRDKPPEPKPPTYIDVVRANNPAYPATQPLVLPLDLPQAAHLVLKDPIYLDSRLLLWITRPDALPTEKILATPNPEYEYIVPERVAFVHWAGDESNTLTPRIVTPRADGGFDYVQAKRRITIPPGRDWRWDRARPWDDKVLVPTATGVSVFKFTSKDFTESYQDLLHGPAPATQAATTSAPASRPAATTQPALAGPPEPQLLYDGEGFIAWIPWERGKPGGHGAARYVNDKWITFDSAAGWPDRIVHLIPLLGGSVMQLISADDGGVKLGVSGLGAANIDRKAIEKLVDALAADSQKARDEAFGKLTQYGPAIRPILKELLDLQPPEAQARMGQLLKEQVQPLLGPMSLLGDKMRVVTRHKDGGVVLHADTGVSLPNAEGDPITYLPAWLSVRPGRPVQMLPASMIADLLPDKAQVQAVESRDDDWVIVGDVRGPRRFIGNGLVNLLRKDEAVFTQLVGVDHRGRWLFRKPADDTQTLILDPTLPDLTPRLPVWSYATADEVGWDKENWPAVKQRGLFNRLKEDRWEALEKETDVLTRPDQIPPTTRPILATQPATKPSTRTTRPTTTALTTSPTTGPTTLTAAPDDPALPPPLLIAPDGTRYYGGLADLRAITPAGRDVTWPLPQAAQGKGPPYPTQLLRTEDNRLWLFNQPGRVLRVKPAPDAADPFIIEATFTRNIPSTDTPTRIWLDPAGRIIIAHDKLLAILFTQGYIPPRLKEFILDTDDEPANNP